MEIVGNLPISMYCYKVSLRVSFVLRVGLGLKPDNYMNVKYTLKCSLSNMQYLIYIGFYKNIIIIMIISLFSFHVKSSSSDQRRISSKLEQEINR